MFLRPLSRVLRNAAPSLRVMQRRWMSAANVKCLVIADHDSKTVQDTTFATITAAKQLGQDVTVLVAGKQCTAVAEQVAKLEGVSKVVVADDASLEHGVAENLANVICEIQNAQKYTHILGGSTAAARSVIPRVAVNFDVQPISEITGVKSADTFVRPMYAGNAIATCQSTDALKLITVRSTAFDKVKAGSKAAPVEKVAVSKADAGLSAFQSAEVRKSERPELTSAKVVVAGGRALKSKEGFKMIFDLADKLGGAVGATRAAVDAGFCGNDLQVGQTGKVVAPELYIAVGISGAIQHLAGMKDSKVIVAINKDAEAPVFSVSDYGLVADLFKVMPELLAAVPAPKA